MSSAASPMTPVAIPNKAARLRFQAALLLYFSWLVYLAWQVAITRFPDGPAPALSRTQWAESEAELIGKPLGNDEFEIIEVLYGPKDLGLKAGKIHIGGLDEAKRMPKIHEEEWTGQRWLVPVKRKGKEWIVAPVPPTPGYRSGPFGSEIGRVYWYTERMRIHARQVREEVFGK